MKKIFVIGSIVPLTAMILQVYNLHILCGIPIGICSLVTVLCLIKYKNRQKKDEEIFFQVSSYMEQLLCSYRRLGHAGKALEDCRMLFDRQSKMGKAVEAAVHILRTGEGVEDGNIYETALEQIESQFNSRRLRIIHRFVCNGEKTGGETGKSADILLEDLECWKNRTRLYEKRKNFTKMECLIAAVLAMIMCYVSKLLTPSELGFHISDSLAYQISTTLAFITIMIIVVNINKRLSGTWLDERNDEDCSRMAKERKMYELLNRSHKKGSIISCHMAKRILTRCVKQEFPYWLLLITLYLQSESIYQALRCTVSETSGVFRSEIERLIEHIYDSPRDLKPYLQFFGKLELTEVSTGMKILYSINNNGYEQSKQQLDFLVSQNNRLVDQCETYHFQTRMAGMSLLKQLPMIVSCVKLLVDLVNLLAMTMGSFQAIQM